jgi:hypothetical protein
MSSSSSQCPIVLRVSSKGRSFDFPVEIKLTGTFEGLSLHDLGIKKNIVIISEEKIHLPLSGEDNVYLLWSEGTTLYNISSFNRIIDFMIDDSFKGNLIYLACCPGGKDTEIMLHTKFEKNRGSKWFNFNAKEINSVIQEFMKLRCVKPSKIETSITECNSVVEKNKDLLKYKFISAVVCLLFLIYLSLNTSE